LNEALKELNDLSDLLKKLNEAFQNEKKAKELAITVAITVSIAFILENVFLLVKSLLN
jgi:hypothetical protein